MIHRLTVSVVGGGVLGLWQAVTLAERGHAVTLYEAASEETTGAASRCAGAMLAPYCEAETAGPVVHELGLRGLALWQRAYPGLQKRGSLVLASRRDGSELRRFARLTRGHRHVDAAEIERLEPMLGDRFPWGLYFSDEGHMAPRPALAFLIRRLRQLGGGTHFSSPVPDPIWMAAAAGDMVIDCRGIAARHELGNLRGVRGEMAVVNAPHLCFSRPLRLLHPRFPLYVVPWGGGTYMIGATSIECHDAGPVTLRSALELLASACAIHSGFADARIVELSAEVRPAFKDNNPRIVQRGRRLIVNGAYRHGFLVAPALAEIVANHLERGTPIPIALTSPDRDNAFGAGASSSVSLTRNP